MKFKVLKNVVHGQKLHVPAGEGKKETVIEIPDEHLHEEHIETLVKDGFLEPLRGKRQESEPAK